MSQVVAQQPILPTEAVLVSRGVLQPFQCPTCSKRFTRYENLKRHSAVHQQGNSFPCSHCTSTFSRRDLRRRHVNKKHPEHRESSSPRPRRDTVTSSAGTGEGDDPSPESPDGEKGGGGAGVNGISGQVMPCLSRFDSVPIIPADMMGSLPRQNQQVPNVSTMQDLGMLFSPTNTTGSSSLPLPTSFNASMGHFDFGDFTGPDIFDQSQGTMAIDPFAPTSYTSTSTLAHISPTIPLSTSTTDPITPEQLALGIELFHTHVASFIPFIHRPTFDPSTLSEPVLFGLLSISLPYASNPEDGQAISSRCFKHAKRLLESHDDRQYSPVVRVQALCLLQMHAIMYSCGNDTTQGLRMRNKTMEVIRREGMMDPLPSKAGHTSDLDALWLHFVRAEVHKRTLYFFYQLDATWYHLLSIPRTVSHLEVKHDLPCCETLWSAESSTAWAHRNLVEPKAKDVPRFIQSIRSWMAPTPTASSVNCSYAALLIVLYLHTGVREVSGWSTMTGRICFERFEAFNSGLMALESVICSNPPDGVFATDAEATWRVTMIELLLWNPSHTSGLVELSMDGAVVSATTLSAAQSVVFTPQVAEMLYPHIMWFLLFLDRTAETPLEPPWVTMYAFKAVLVAWQLARAGNMDCINKLGVGDVSGFSGWMRRAFRRRGTTGVGRLIMKSLESLDDLEK